MFGLKQPDIVLTTFANEGMQTILQGKNTGKLLCCHFAISSWSRQNSYAKKPLVEVTKPTAQHNIACLPQLAGNQILPQDADLGSPPQPLKTFHSWCSPMWKTKLCKIQPSLWCWDQWYCWFCLFPGKSLKIRQHKKFILGGVNYSTFAFWQSVNAL